MFPAAKAMFARMKGRDLLVVAASLILAGVTSPALAGGPNHDRGRGHDNGRWSQRDHGHGDYSRRRDRRCEPPRREPPRCAPVRSCGRGLGIRIEVPRVIITSGGRGRC
mgnify:CR=1 FL=1